MAEWVISLLKENVSSRCSLITMHTACERPALFFKSSKWSVWIKIIFFNCLVHRFIPESCLNGPSGPLLYRQRSQRPCFLLGAKQTGDQWVNLRELLKRYSFTQRKQNTVAPVFCATILHSYSPCVPYKEHESHCLIFWTIIPGLEGFESIHHKGLCFRYAVTNITA